ncbi:MAG: aminotransferase class V-fold PLP-dependent enzyme [Isosphaeraceae bacterium]
MSRDAHEAGVAPDDAVMTVDWERLRREEFPVAERWAYLDHAAVAPLPRSSARVLRAWVDDQEANGVVHWLDWEAKLTAARGDLARLIGARTDEIAYVNSTTQGIGIVAEGFPWRPGDNVVTAAEEYPSNLYPWMNLADRGVTLRTVPSRGGRVELGDLFAAVDGSTRLLTISHVEFASGFRNDLDAIGGFCRERGIAFFVDAIQGLGPLTIDVGRTPVDFLAADGHKWLLGPEGAGFLYVRSEWVERLRPVGVGWHSVVASFNSSTVELKFKPGAERWEGGSFAMPGLQAFAASVGLILRLGPQAVSERILDRAEAVREIVRSAGWTIEGSTRPGDLSGIVAVTKPGVDPNVVVKALRERGVAAACRRERLRFSPHVYTNRDDLDRLAEALAEF